MYVINFIEACGGDAPELNNVKVTNTKEEAMVVFNEFIKGFGECMGYEDEELDYFMNEYANDENMKFEYVDDDGYYTALIETKEVK